MNNCIECGNKYDRKSSAQTLCPECLSTRDCKGTGEVQLDPSSVKKWDELGEFQNVNIKEHSNEVD